MGVEGYGDEDEDEMGMISIDDEPVAAGKAGLSEQTNARQLLWVGGR
jgi:hypothetical protein